MTDTIERQAAIDEIKDMYVAAEKWAYEAKDEETKARAESCMATNIEMKLRIEKLPSAQPERDMPKRVLWTGWKGDKNTRYKCQCCKKRVWSGDKYCRRCGQKLIFPIIFTLPHVQGEKQETIVRWADDE